MAMCLGAMFPEFHIESITNGVHVPTWVGPRTASMFDRHLPRWRHDNALLRYAASIPLDDIREAHAEAKQTMADEVARRTGVVLACGFSHPRCRSKSNAATSATIFSSPSRSGFAHWPTGWGRSR